MIAGNLVQLKPISRDQFRKVYEWQVDPEVSYYVYGEPYACTAPEEAFMQSYDPMYLENNPRENAVFGIFVNEDDEFIGTVDYRDVDLVVGSAVIGATIGNKQYWGRGLGTDAVRTLCTFLFQRFALSRIQLDTWDGNTRAIRSYEKVGFQIEGRLRKATLVKGEPADVIIMGLLRQDFDE